MAISLKTLQQNYNQYVYSDNDPTHEYFNMGLFNEYTPNNTSPRTLKFNQIKQAPIIDKCDNYYLSIIRWNLQSNLPVLIPDIQIKPNKESFTGLTDYELSFFYNVETSTQLVDTFGLIGANGTNYLGIYKNTDFGFLKKVLINFPPDNSASVDYDNFNNGLGTSGNGSIYIISSGVIKVFDKVSNQVLLTKTAPAGSSYKFLCANKSTGDFYFGTINNTNNDIFYTKGERTGANTWDFTGSTYSSPSNKNNVAGIAYVNDNSSLDELSAITSPPDTLYGLEGDDNMYNVDDNQQLTNSPILISPLVYVSSDYYFAVGNDHNTYAIISPISPQPSAMFIANNNISLKYIYTKQALAGLYGLGTSNLYYQFNVNTPPGIPPQNEWSLMGELAINNTATGFLSLDSFDSTNYILAVGSDLNLYQSTYPIAPYEFGYINSINDPFTTNLAALMGFDFAGSKNYITNPALPFDNTPASSISITGVFEHAQNYYVVNSAVTIIEYSGLTNAVLNTYNNLDTNISNIVSLPTTSAFAYSNLTSSTIVVRLTSTPTTILQTFNLPSPICNGICELDATHIAVVCLNDILIYTYNNANPVNIINLGSESGGASDITANKNDQVNGASKLFYLNNNLGTLAGNELYYITFTDNTYVATQNNPTLLFQCENGRYSNYIQCKPENGTICLLDYVPSGNGYYNDRQMHFLFQTANYNSVNSYSIDFPFTNGLPYVQPNKLSMWMNNSTVSTHQFTQVTSNIELLSACVSRTNGDIYGVGKDDLKIYSGTINNGSITFNRLSQFENQYSQLSSIPRTGGPTLQNIINQWDATGAPSLTQIIDQSSTISTNPSPLSLYTDGNYLYAVYNNINNLAYINKLNPVGLAQILKNSLGNLLLLNGIVGYDYGNHLLLSNVVEGVNALTQIDPATLELIINYIDPSIDNGTSTMMTFPFDYFETTTSYAQLGETTTLIFLPETVNVNLETFLDYPRNKEELYNNPYFYIKYVDTFCRMINNAIKTAWSTTGGTWAKLPYFQWDSALNKIVFNQPTSTPTGTPAAVGSNFYISVNQPLYNLLNTFRFKYYPTNSGNGSLYPESAECRYLLDTNILFDGVVQAGGEYVTYLQQISSVQTWTPIQSWVFSSTIIPIESQLTGQPQNLNDIDPTTQGNIYKQQAITKVLTDFIVPLNTGVEATNQNVFYTPAGEYRLVDLIGGASLNQLSLEIKWRDKYGVDHDMYIDAGASANLLVLLRKKSYNSKM